MCTHTSTYVLILLYVSSEELFGGVTNASQISALLPEDFPSSVLDAGEKQKKGGVASGIAEEKNWHLTEVISQIPL